jgi:hypothetical protein
MYSIFQIFLVIFSILILWGVLVATQVVFILDFFYYISVIAIYWTLKGGFLGLNYFKNKIQASDFEKPDKQSIWRRTRKRYKPIKPFEEW